MALHGCLYIYAMVRIVLYFTEAQCKTILLQLEFPGNPLIFGSGSRTDYDDANRKIAGISQGGLGLPDRDYYLNDEPKSKEIREHYLRHVQRILELLGNQSELAKA